MRRKRNVISFDSVDLMAFESAIIWLLLLLLFALRKFSGFIMTINLSRNREQMAQIYECMMVICFFRIHIRSRQNHFMFLLRCETQFKSVSAHAFHPIGCNLDVLLFDSLGMAAASVASCLFVMWTYPRTVKELTNERTKKKRTR